MWKFLVSGEGVRRKDNILTETWTVVRVLLVALLLTGCIGRPPMDDGGPAAAQAVPTVFQFNGTIEAGVGATTPIQGGCEGFTATPRDHTYTVELAGAEAILTADLEAGSAAPTRLRLCLFGLGNGTLSVVGVPPLRIESPLAGEHEVIARVLVANDPPTAIGPTDYTLRVEAR